MCTVEETSAIRVHATRCDTIAIALPRSSSAGRKAEQLSCTCWKPGVSVDKWATGTQDVLPSAMEGPQNMPRRRCCQLARVAVESRRKWLERY